MRILKLLILTAILCAAWPGKAKTVSVRLNVPEWVRFKTVSPEGTAEFWATKPFKVVPDGAPQSWFWWSETAPQFRGVIETGVPNRHPNKIWRVR